jgi:nicotinamidase-related amidase
MEAGRRRDKEEAMKYIPNLDDPAGKALVIIDMQIEDSPQGFWQAYNWNATVANSQKVLNACRNKAYPVVHLMVARRPDGVDCHPFDLRDEKGKPIYSVDGTENCQIVDALKPLKDEIVVKKQRFSAFYQTNLSLILKGLNATHLIMMGVFTDSCFLTSVYDAFTRHYTISIVKDACTAGTKAAHMTSILDMANWIYGCSIFNADQIAKAINGQNYKAWFWHQPNSTKYEIDTIEEMYSKLDE